MIPPTPTPLALWATPVYTGPHISLWDFTSSALQVWNTAGPFVIVVQAIILVSLVIAAVGMALIWFRQITNRKED